MIEVVTNYPEAFDCIYKCLEGIKMSEQDMKQRTLKLRQEIDAASAELEIKQRELLELTQEMERSYGQRIARKMIRPSSKVQYYEIFDNGKDIGEFSTTLNIDTMRQVVACYIDRAIAAQREACARAARNVSGANWDRVMSAIMNADIKVDE